MQDNGASSYHRFLKGDQTGLEELVRAYGDSLVRFAYCFLKDASAAEDAMENAFAKLIVKRRRFDGDINLRAYLFRVVRNECMDILRAAKRSLSYDDNVEQVLQEDPESEAALSERNKTLYRAILTLPENYRKTLELVYFEGFTAADAAKILKKNKKQTYNLLARARTYLKKILIKEGFDNEDL